MHRKRSSKIKANLAELFKAANEGLPYDESRLDHLLQCMEKNPEYKREKEIENQQVGRFVGSYMSQSHPLPMP